MELTLSSASSVALSGFVLLTVEWRGWVELGADVEELGAATDEGRGIGAG